MIKVFFHCLWNLFRQPWEDHRGCTWDRHHFCTCGYNNGGVTWDQHVAREKAGTRS